MSETDYKAEFEKLQSSIIEQEIARSFYAAGGKKPIDSPSPDSPSPLDLVKAALRRGEIKMNGTEVQIVGADGFPRPLDYKIAELKAAHSVLFEPQAQESKPTGKTYTAEQVRMGKASIEEIANGKASIVD